MPYTIYDGLEYDECKQIQNSAQTYNMNIEIEQDNISKTHNNILENVDVVSLKNPNYVKANNTVVSCPKCGCTNIQVVRKKFSLLAGFATNKTERVCANCMYRW